MNSKIFTKLPESELLVMQLIWDMDKKGSSDIHAGAMIKDYPEAIGHLALTTVLTLMNRLKDKGFIALEKHGRTNCAVALVDEDEYKRHAAAHFLDTVYEMNTKGLVSALIADGFLTMNEIDEIRREIEKDK